jgi:hypothetical protein
MKRLIHLALVVIFLLTASTPVIAADGNDPAVFSCADVSEMPQAECEALVAFYSATNGDG